MPILRDRPPQKEFKGKAGSAARVRLGGQAVKVLTLVGLGKKSAFKSARAVSCCCLVMECAMRGGGG